MFAGSHRKWDNRWKRRQKRNSRGKKKQKRFPAKAHLMRWRFYQDKRFDKFGGFKRKWLWNSILSREPLNYHCDKHFEWKKWKIQAMRLSNEIIRRIQWNEEIRFWSTNRKEEEKLIESKQICLLKRFFLSSCWYQYSSVHSMKHFNFCIPLWLSHYITHIASSIRFFILKNEI